MEEPEKQLEEMEERASEVGREIDDASDSWESTKKDVPSADEEDEETPVDEG